MKENHVFRVKLDKTEIYAQKIQDSRDLLIEFYISDQFYDKQIVKPGHFWYNWILKQINANIEISQKEDPNN